MNDEAIEAHSAIEKLLMLYDAYRATSQANILLMARIIRELEPDTPQYETIMKTLRAREALSQQSYLTFQERSKELLLRRDSLRKEHTIP